MTRYSLSSMVKGWFVGPFEPSAFSTNDVEVGVKAYSAGEAESAHVHKVATEITCVLDGRVRMNDVELMRGDILVLQPGEASDFEALTDARIVVAKIPGVLNDKYECS